MATTLKKQFLDYAGLQTFWSIIDHKFANKTDAVKVDSFSIANRTKDNFDIAYTDSNDALSGTAAKVGYSFTLPAADENNAGLLSAEHFALIDDIDNKINEAAPFHGLKLSGNEVARDGAKRANIGLNFVTEGSVDAGTRKAYIDLVDLNYPETGTWSPLDAADYDAKKPHHTAYTKDGETTYWVWSVEGAKGPVNNLGEPLYNKPVSRIDVSELVKAGLLQDADVILKEGAMYLKLVFITNGAGTETKEVLINVTDLVDIYTEGEGIEIVNDAMSAGDNSREGTIKLRVANYDAASGTNTLGGIRVGYTTVPAKQQYKVQLDANGNAFVAVPWEHTTVSASTTGANGEGSPYLVVSSTPTTTQTVDDNGNAIITTNYDVKVEAGEGLKRAEGLAKTAVQTVKVGAISETADVITGDAQVGITKDAYLKVETVDNGGWGRYVKTELTDSAKASLGLADTSVQKVVTTNVERGDEHTPTEGTDLIVSLVNDANAEYGDEKGQKTIKITLGEKTTASLDKADTAMQTITIMGTTLDIDDPVYETAEAKKALSLGGAAYVNTVDVMPDAVADDAHKADFQSNVLKPDSTEEARFHVATTYAVKKYVDDQNTAQSETLRKYTDDAVAALDSSVEVTNGEAIHADYTAAYGAGVLPHQVMVGVTQEDGKLKSATPYVLGITDIADFAPLSTADINTICGITPAAPAE